MKRHVREAASDNTKTLGIPSLAQKPTAPTTASHTHLHTEFNHRTI